VRPYDLKNFNDFLDPKVNLHENSQYKSTSLIPRIIFYTFSSAIFFGHWPRTSPAQTKSQILVRSIKIVQRLY